MKLLKSYYEIIKRNKVIILLIEILSDFAHHPSWFEPESYVCNIQNDESYSSFHNDTTENANTDVLKRY